jgi:hypothetical protein
MNAFGREIASNFSILKMWTIVNPLFIHELIRC